MSTAQAVDTGNYVYVAITANFWGSGKTESLAIANMRKAGGSGQMKRYGYSTYRVHPDFEVNGVDGSVMTPIGHPAIKVTDKRKEKAR